MLPRRAALMTTTVIDNIFYSERELSMVLGWFIIKTNYRRQYAGPPRGN